MASDRAGSRPGVVVVGTGFGCRVHVPALRAAGFEVVALVGVDAGRTARRAERSGVPRSATSLADALTLPGVEAVTIATPPGTHAALAIEAARAGKHVLCEKPFALDAGEAAAMLDAAGHKAGADGERFKLTIDYLPGADDQQKNVAEYIRGQLKKIGITVEVRASADFPAWSKRMATHDFDMSMDIVFNWGDPVIGVARTYVSSNIKPIVWTNTQSYKNKEVDQLLATAGGVLDPVKRKAYYATFEKIVTDDLPIEFINVVPYHTAASKKVGNLPTTSGGRCRPITR